MGLLIASLTLSLATPVLGEPVLSELAPLSLEYQQWDANPLAWRFTPGGVSVSNPQADHAIFAAAPESRTVVIEAQVKVLRSTGKRWNIAGVSVYRDPRNFWHFAMVEAPQDEGGRRFCELSEMRDGVWLAQNNLKRVVDERSKETWKPGQVYRLRLALDAKGIEGRLSDLDGRVLRRIRYEFSTTAVDSGRVALRCNGFEAEFKAIAGAHAGTVPETKTPLPAYACKSHVEDISGKRTGFFHVEQRDGKWWAIDPLGRGFVPLGVDHVTYRGHFCEELGHWPHKLKNDKRYPNRETWEKETIGRLSNWGFNLLSAGSSPQLFHKGLAHTRFLSIGSRLAHMGDEYNITPNMGVPCSAMPNVFHPDFERYCVYLARGQCASSVGDPWLFGYFLDNELKWWGVGNVDTGLFDAVLKKGPKHSAKLALRDFLARRYGGEIAKLNAAWGVELESFDKILERESLGNANKQTVTDDKKAFAGLVGELYFSVLTKAIRSVDPDHMIIGSRFAGGHAADMVWQAAGRYCDINTFNYYGNVDLDRGIALDDDHHQPTKTLRQVFEKFYQLGGRPMMVTEWSFPAIDSGLPCTHGAGQRFQTQEQRARATEIFAKTTLRMPFMVGYDYFMWVDEPALGISKIFPENTNYGLIDEDAKAYEPLVAAFTKVHRDAGQLRHEATVADSSTVAPRPSEVEAPVAAIKRIRAITRDAGSPVVFEREGDRYKVDAGGFVLEGRVGGNNLVDRVSWRGVVLGRYNAMMQQCNDHDQWVGVNRLVDVQAKKVPGGLAIDLIGRYEDANPSGSRRPFEIAHRITLLNGADYFVDELLWCRNTGNLPIEMRSFYFRPHAEIGGSAKGDISMKQKGVPRLWQAVRGDAWVDPAEDVFWGLTIGEADPTRIHFWLNEQGGQHPDAHRKTEFILPPGKTFRPASPLYVVGVAGKGKRLQWEKKAGEIW